MIPKTPVCDAHPASAAATESGAPSALADLIAREADKRARRAAYSTLKEALKRGDLVRPSECSQCGTIPERCRNGASRIQAHHHVGYDRPLDVVWICALCHRAETPSNPLRGEAAHNSKLTAAIVTEIRKSDDTTNALARQYGVNRSLVFQVRTRRTWRHIQ